jgi:glycosyltransferase involved in cell wall biosynthesis
MIYISVIVITKNRPNQINDCITSVLKSDYDKFECIIVDQSYQASVSASIVKNSHIRYFHKPGRGKNSGLNYAISHSKGTILAFTDDDCIVHREWLSLINKQFSNDFSIDAIFGNTFPYNPKKNKGKICPCVSIHKQVKRHSKPIAHWKIGFGNNMSIRKNVFDEIGLFKPWLGHGSIIGSGGGDCEFITRMLTHNKILLNHPKIIVFHNRWLSENQEKKQQLLYTYGEMVCYGYYASAGFAHAQKIVDTNWNRSKQQWSIFSKKIIRGKSTNTDFQEILYELQLLLRRMYGRIISVIFSVIDPI